MPRTWYKCQHIHERLTDPRFGGIRPTGAPALDIAAPRALGCPCGQAPDVLTKREFSTAGKTRNLVTVGVLSLGVLLPCPDHLTVRHIKCYCCYAQDAHTHTPLLLRNLPPRHDALESRTPCENPMESGQSDTPLCGRPNAHMGETYDVTLNCNDACSPQCFCNFRHPVGCGDPYGEHNKHQWTPLRKTCGHPYVKPGKPADTPTGVALSLGSLQPRR